MRFLDIPTELLLMVVDNLSLSDLLIFRSTCRQVQNVLKQVFQRICLQDVGELTAIQWAAVHGYAQLIELAILNGAKIDAPLQGRLERIKIHKAPVYPHNIWQIFAWANNSAKTKAKDSIIRTPLFLAACFGHVNAIEVLLKQGAHMQCFGEMNTPAHISAERGDIDCVEKFIQFGFNINARGINDQTILHGATYSGIEILNFILQLEGGPNLVNSQDNSGLTPLSYLAKYYNPPNGQKQLTVELLLQQGANIYARDHSGQTAAHCFAGRGWVDCMQPLINAGFNFHSRGKNDETILHRAMYGGKKMVEYLLSQDGGNRILDIESADEKTPLHYVSRLPVCDRGQVEELLMQHGATSFTW